MCHVGTSMRDPAEIPAVHLVSVPEASARSGIPKRTLYRWIAKEKVWSIAVSGRIMMHEDDVRMMELRKVS